MAQILPTVAPLMMPPFRLAIKRAVQPPANQIFINMITVSAGTLSFSKASDSPTGNNAAGATALVLGRWELKPTGEDMEIRQLSYSVIRSAARILPELSTLKLKSPVRLTTQRFIP